MNRAMALKAAAFQKARKVKMAADKDANADLRRRQWEWNHFEPQVWGSPGPHVSWEEYIAIIADARQNKQNVFFGDGWKDPQTVNSRSKLSWWERFLGVDWTRT